MCCSASFVQNYTTFWVEVTSGDVRLDSSVDRTPAGTLVRTRQNIMMTSFITSLLTSKDELINTHLSTADLTSHKRCPNMLETDQ